LQTFILVRTTNQLLLSTDNNNNLIHYSHLYHP